jgi:hypothetical protein
MGLPDLPPTLTGADATQASQFSLQRAPTSDKNASLSEAREILGANFEIIGPQELDETVGQNIAQHPPGRRVYFSDGHYDDKNTDIGIDAKTLKEARDYADILTKNGFFASGSKPALLFIPGNYRIGEHEWKTLTTRGMYEELVYPSSNGPVDNSCISKLSAGFEESEEAGRARWAIVLPEVAIEHGNGIINRIGEILKQANFDPDKVQAGGNLQASNADFRTSWWATFVKHMRKNPASTRMQNDAKKGYDIVTSTKPLNAQMKDRIWVTGYNHAIITANIYGQNQKIAEMLNPHFIPVVSVKPKV